jgi:hypothetical protein
MASQWPQSPVLYNTLACEFYAHITFHANGPAPLGWQLRVKRHSSSSQCQMASTKQYQEATVPKKAKKYLHAAIRIVISHLHCLQGNVALAANTALAHTRHGKDGTQ